MRKLNFIFLVLFIIIDLSAQNNNLNYLSDNYSAMIPQRVYSKQIGQAYNPNSYYTHPDFGTLTFDAPFGKKVVENLSKRTIDERYYTDIDNPLFFYIQKSSKPLNFYKNGYLIAIDPTLKLLTSGIYKAENQPCPTELNTIQKNSTIILGNDFFSFNNYSLQITKNDNTIELYTSNWSNISVGNNGAYVTNVFPGIDMKIMYREASVKSEFIIKQNLNIKSLIFTDSLQIGSNLKIELETIAIGNPENPKLLVKNLQSNQTLAEINPARIYDNSGSKRSWFVPYTFIINKLGILCDSLILNSSQTVYPITVDPLVTAVGPIVAGTTNLMGSLPTPAFCSNVIAITFPGGTTPWDTQVGWSIYSNYCYGNLVDCYRSEAQVTITSTCGGYSGVWGCPGCNSYGYWTPTIAFANDDIYTLARCYAGSCTNQTMNFTINLNRTYCNSSGTYDKCPANRSYCQTLDNWNVTVQGRSMETLGNTATGNGTSAVSAVCFAGQTLNPTPLYGIGPYTYLWSPGGEVTSTKTIPTVYIGSQTHNVTVKDACNTSRLATFNVSTNCQLPIELLSFTGLADGKKVNLNWLTATETNSSHFIVERSYDGINFKKIDSVKAAGNSLQKRYYDLTDSDADLNNIVYYKLKQFDIGIINEKFSTIIYVEGNMEKSINVFPNPSNGLFDIVASGNYDNVLYDVNIYNYLGMQVFYKTNISSKTTINLSDFANGIYLIKININGKLISKYLVKE